MARVNESTIQKLNIYDTRNLTMLVDFYEITMANGYFKEGLKDN